MSEPTQEHRATALDHTAGQVVTGRERFLAIARWLLDAADDEEQARREWKAGGIALLRCGRSFDAVCVPLVLVETAAGTTDRQRLAAYLHEALLGGPVFLDTASHLVYCLLSTSTPPDWRPPDCGHFGRDNYLGVPLPGGPDTARSYWLVEPDAPGAVCVLDAVSQMVTFAHFRAATRDGQRRA
ncbi:hypothetical protein [Streptomyces sp. NBC_00425]|uniref:hypothetical protein n=1 Tax=Streptomyces sp. NBC_00425 TaxID=2975740 RepID=UPI002E1ADE7C